MKVKPNIAKLPFNDKSRVKTLVTQIINDVVLYSHIPDQIVLLDDIITLVLWNKRYYFEEMQIDNPKDYTQVYLQGIKVSTNDYQIGINGENIVITFNDKLVPFQNELILEDFVIKGKIVNI